ncbi:MAG: hypothetical protein ABSF83_04595 [Nitrososphaerales archaeon]|jgi:hypothetical protein
MVDKVARGTSGEGGASGRYCVFCKEEGEPEETARDVVTIRLREGGRPRRVALCKAHADALGGPGSMYEAVRPPTKVVPAKGLARQTLHVEGKSEKGNINRTLRRAEGYSKGQRGRLGE